MLRYHFIIDQIWVSQLLLFVWILTKSLFQRLLGPIKLHEMTLFKITLLIFLLKFQFLFDDSGKLLFLQELIKIWLL